MVKPPKLLAEEEAPFARGQVSHPPFEAQYILDRPTLQVLSTFEDHVSCEICTLKMWQPYTYVHLVHILPC